MTLRAARPRRSWSLVGIVTSVVLAGLVLTGQTRSPAQAPRRPAGPSESDARPIRVLLLGSEAAPVQPQPATPPAISSAAFYQSLAPALARRGIQLTHVATPGEALTAARLSHYDALMLYGAHDTITPAEEQSLQAFVQGGKGVVAIDAAAAMFPASTMYGALIGGRSPRATAAAVAELTPEIVEPGHPILQGIAPFPTFDDPSPHTQVNPAGRTVLMERAGGAARDPWTWVRSEGKGRVFYTAYGHDERTWGHASFHKLIEQATVWTVAEPVRRAWVELKMPQVTYVDTFVVPNYENRDPAPKYQLPFTPDESMQFIQLPAEFRLELFASEPDITEPIAFNFDARGRLWIIEALNYPNVVLNGAPGDDRIKIVEDVNGDGRADKFTVFADGLNLPTSLVFANGGVIVAAAPHMLFLKDTNGDDKADLKEILSTGWGTRDTHAGPSSLMYGPDNYIWGTVGYSGFQGEMNGKPTQFGQGMYRFKPDGSGFEYITGSTNNTWGLGMSETFDVFGSTANNDPSFFVAIANRYFEGVQGLPMPPGGGRGVGAGYQSAAQFYTAHHLTPYIRQVDVFGGYTAGAGHQIYTARAFPKPYWNRIAFINEPTAHLIGQGIIEKRGAGFVTRDGWNLLAGAEEWVAPVQAQVGPDGAVWVSDWYNFIAQHNPTPQGFSNGVGNAYETSMRDGARGRIYRVVHRAAPAVRPLSLSPASGSSLVAALASDNMLWRLHAQRLLVERGQKDVVPALVALVRNRAVDEIGLNGAALHALWTLHGLGAITSLTTSAGAAAVDALAHPAAGVRKAAAMVLPKTVESATALAAAGLLTDPDLHTRLAVLLALADTAPSPEIGRLLYQAGANADNYTDRWLSRALFIAGTRHKEGFLAAYKADAAAVPAGALPIALRIGTTKPDWRSPDATAVAADWKPMEIPGNWESRGLPDFDGVVWFTRTVDVAAAGGDATLALGRISNSAEVWVNGLSVNAAVPAPAAVPPAAAPAAAQGRGTAGRGGAGGTGRGNLPPPAYELPPGTLKPGPNTVTVRITNNRNDGGFLGAADSLFLQAGQSRTPLAGPWHYRVERQTNAGALYTRAGELAAHLAYSLAPTPSGGTLPAEEVVRQAPDLTIRLSVIAGEMKFDKPQITVAPGQLVEIVFSNPDTMQHNFVLGAPSSLEALGAAADDLARGPNGIAQQYVPQTQQVLFSTRLVEPGETLTVQFRVPAQTGQYPYVCTFPGHWRIMNGVLQVVAPQGRGGPGQ